MRAGVIQRVLVRLLWFTVAALAVPLIMSVALLESVWYAWLIPAVAAGAVAFALGRRDEVRKAAIHTLRRREGFIAVTLGWVVLVFFTAVGYRLSGYYPAFSLSVFEAMSGYTTTGATVAADIEALPASLLFMRSFSHWIGGMGIIVLSVAILPELAVGGMQLFAAESSGIDSDKLAPRIAATARRLWFLYVAITAVQVVLLLLGGMTLFEAINHAMATIATGGFSTRNDSIGAFDSLYIELVVVAFMFISGMSFTLQYRALVQRQPGRLLRNPEVRLYTMLTGASVLAVAINLYATDTYDGIGESLRYSAFSVVSILTTTGFGTADFDEWPDFCRFALVALMLIGGCAGSTAGGSKVIRLVIVVKHAISQLHRLIRPRLVEGLRLGDREVSKETTEAVLGFYLLYFAATSVGAMVMTAIGLDLVSGTTGAISAMNSIGPGLGTLGASGSESYAHVPDAGLYVLSVGMLLGRLEIYTVLVLFSSHFWRRG